MRRRISLAVLLACVLLLPRASPAAADDPPHPRRSSSGIILTADGSLLLAVNPDSNSVTLVDTASFSVVAELGVGLDPRTVAVDDAGRWAYVANRGASSISVVDLAVPEVVEEVSVGHRPYGVVVSPDGSQLYVAVQGTDRIVILDTATLEIVRSVPVADRPSGLALTDEGRTLYVTHLLGNRVTVVSLERHSLYLPLIVKGVPIAFSRALQSQTADTPAPVMPHAVGPASTATILLWPESNLVQSIVLSADGLRAYVPHTRSNSANMWLNFDTTVSPLVSVIDVPTRKHLVGQQIDLGSVDPPGVGLPFDAAVTTSGDELWVVNAASNDLSVIDLPSRTLTAHIEVGDNPRGIVLSPDATSAYVNNTLAGTVSVLDTAAYAVTSQITVTQIPLPPVLLRGKRLFHTSDDPRLARAQWISCNTCHFEGEQDGKTWFFAFAGPRNTTSLLGMIETYPLRWSGEWDESADSEFANRKENFGGGLIDGDLNCALFPPDCVGPPPNQGRSYDLDSLSLFLDSLAVPLSPSHAGGEPLTEAEQRGQALFEDPGVGCATCHPSPLYTDHRKHDVGTATTSEKIGPEYDTPSLRGLYDSAPYFHDGSAPTLYDTLTRPSPGGEHDVSSILEVAEIQDLVAFLLALPFE